MHNFVCEVLFFGGVFSSGTGHAFRVFFFFYYYNVMDCCFMLYVLSQEFRFYVVDQFQL